MIPDAADLCRQWLDGKDITACCEPVPKDLAAHLPLTVLSNGGGSVEDYVLCNLRVEAWTHASDLAAAMAESQRVCECLLAMAGDVDRTTVYGCSLQQAPAEGFDPSNPEVRLAGCVVEVSCRTQ